MRLLHVSIALVLVTTACKKKEKTAATVGSNAPIASGSAPAEGSSAPNGLDAPPAAEPADAPLPAPTVVDKPGAARDKATPIKLGETAEGAIEKEDFYSFELAPKLEYRVEVALRGNTGGPLADVNVGVMDPDENLVAGVDNFFTDQSDGWVRGHNIEIPPADAPRKLVLKVYSRTGNANGRYRVRIKGP